MRHNPSGRYYHDTLSQVLGTDDGDKAIRNVHHQVFSEWLNFGLAEQKSDLGDYLGRRQPSRDTHEYRHLPPASAREVERQLYITDLETLLELLKYEEDGAFLSR